MNLMNRNISSTTVIKTIATAVSTEPTSRRLKLPPYRTVQEYISAGVYVTFFPTFFSFPLLPSQ